MGWFSPAENFKLFETPKHISSSSWRQSTRMYRGRSLKKKFNKYFFFLFLQSFHVLILLSVQVVSFSLFFFFFRTFALNMLRIECFCLFNQRSSHLSTSIDPLDFWNLLKPINIVSSFFWTWFTAFNRITLFFKIFFFWDFKTE